MDIFFALESVRLRYFRSVKLGYGQSVTDIVLVLL